MIDSPGAVFGVALTRPENEIYVGILPHFSFGMPFPKSSLSFPQPRPDKMIHFVEVLAILAGCGIVIAFMLLQLARASPIAFIYSALLGLVSLTVLALADLIFY